MNICEYGCGREGKFKFKNGKWCCSKYWRQCPGKKMAESKEEIKEESKIESGPLLSNKEFEELTKPIIEKKESPPKVIAAIQLPLPIKDNIIKPVPKKESFFKRLRNWFTF